MVGGWRDRGAGAVTPGRQRAGHPFCREEVEAKGLKSSSWLEREFIVGGDTVIRGGSGSISPGGEWGEETRRMCSGRSARRPRSISGSCSGPGRGVSDLPSMSRTTRTLGDIL